jgi:hypothetical protein
VLIQSNGLRLRFQVLDNIWWGWGISQLGTKDAVKPLLSSKHLDNQVQDYPFQPVWISRARREA